MLGISTTKDEVDVVFLLDVDVAVGFLLEVEVDFLLEVDVKVSLDDEDGGQTCSSRQEGSDEVL